MTAPWTTADAIRDASDQTAQHADDMRAEAIGSPNDWAEDDGPTDEGRPWSREQWMETGNGHY